MDLKELESGVDPEVHWYYQSKILPLTAYVKKILKKNNKGLTIIDLGSGSGFFALSLEKRFPEIKKVYLVDIGYTAEEIKATTGQKIEKTLYIPPTIENGLVIMMDVLEHIEDDLAILKSIKKAAKPGSNHFFITVPAFKSLWSGHDVYLGHYRRYKINTLSDVLNKADFKLKRIYYIYGALFLPVWLIRQISNMRKKDASSNMKPAGSLINSLLLNFNALEMKIAAANKLFGITCVAEGEI